MNETAQKVTIAATGVVRDKDGNIKCDIRIVAEATPEEVRQIFGTEVTQNGSQSPDRDA